jgi:hypothetical protein
MICRIRELIGLWSRSWGDLREQFPSGLAIKMFVSKQIFTNRQPATFDLRAFPLVERTIAFSLEI